MRCFAAGMVSLGLSLAGLIGCTATTPTEPPRGAPLVLEPALQGTIRSVLKGYWPPVSTITVTRVDEVYLRGVGILNPRAEITFARRHGGTWAHSATINLSDRGPRSVMHVIQVCGLFDLVYAGGDLKVEQASEDIFRPFGIYAPFSRGKWSKLTKFDATVENVCTPSVGMEFSIHMEYDVWTRPHASVIESMTTSKETVEVSCAGSSQMRPARELGLPVDGDVLPISCTRSLPTTKETAEYVYVPKIGLYLFVSQGRPGDVRTIKARYDLISYR